MSAVEPMRSNPAHALRFGIDCLQVDTRRALLDAIGQETIIAGAYTDGKDGSICPSVLVHRRGAEGNLTGFARAWDAFTGAVPGRPRVATGHEMRVLREMLEASLTREEARRERVRRALGPAPGIEQPMVAQKGGAAPARVSTRR
ncbi:MAG: hypothetical protein ACR2KD_03025 [Thermoleophilaceae bacterium]|jgi:hypothetical protein